MKDRTKEFEEYFYSLENFKTALDYATKKGLSKEMISILTEPKGRAILYEAISEGRYFVEPPRVQLIPKDNGEFRKVYINNNMDRLVLHMINDSLCYVFPDMIHKNCVSYQKGIGVSRVIKKVLYALKNTQNEIVGYKVDLSKYFDSVNKETLYKFLEELPIKGEAKRIVDKYYHDDKIIDEHGSHVEHYKSLAQGCSVSAFLANAILYPIDKTLSEMKIVYFRYSDDILMIGKDADEALVRLKSMLEDRGLTLNPKKIENIEKDKPFSFLGFNICDGIVTLTKKKENKFKKEIKNITKLTKDKRKHSRTEQKKAIKKILKLMSFVSPSGKKNNYGWSRFYFETINSEEYIKMLDEYIKDHIKMLYTGKGNHTTNRNKTSNEDLKEMGYISMVRLWKDYRQSVDLFNAELASVGI